MKLSEAIEQANTITLPQHKLCEIINKQAELLEEAKRFIEIKPNTPSETIYLHDKFNILLKLTEAEI